MKKAIYFTMVVLLSMALIGSISAEEKVKPDNKSAVIESSAAQEQVETTQQEAAPAVDIAANKMKPGNLCTAQKDKCCPASPVNPDTKACRNFLKKCGNC